jgi:glycosyltransferase involved in cell wall biosynthesis
MTDLPGISFLVPVYNKLAYLPQVIEGLRQQRGGFEREFVFIDDGSTDGSGAALAALTAGWPDARILSQPNRGPSIATNRAIAAAQFPVIKLVDGDDVLLPDAARLLLDLLLRHPQAVLAYGRTEQYGSADEACRRIERSRGASGPDALPARVEPALAMMLRQTDLGPTNCLFRTDAVRRVGGCDERVFTQDYSLLLRLATLGPFVGTETVVALTPAGTAERINDGGPQVLHDNNLALLHFLAEHPLPRGTAGPAIRRALNRAWLWARRRERAGPISRWSAMRLGGWVPIASLRLALLRRSCGAFTLSRNVRRSAPA